MGVGRGDFALKEWGEARRLVRARRTIPTALYIAGDRPMCENI
jgi:hypothetical protein